MVNVGLELADDVAAGLYHLWDNRNVDLSAWVQGLIRLGLPAEMQDQDLAPALVGWTPVKLDDNSWGAVHDAPQLLPGSLVGRRIVISAKGRDGRAWTTKVLGVLVRDTKRHFAAVKFSRQQTNCPSSGIAVDDLADGAIFCS